MLKKSLVGLIFEIKILLREYLISKIIQTYNKVSLPDNPDYYLGDKTKIEEVNLEIHLPPHIVNRIIYVFEKKCYTIKDSVSLLINLK